MIKDLTDSIIKSGDENKNAVVFSSWLWCK